LDWQRFSIVFAVNSSIHSYMIPAYTETEDVSLNVGFYYMANAAVRLLGTLLSGALFLTGGLQACLWCSAVMVASPRDCGGWTPRFCGHDLDDGPQQVDRLLRSDERRQSDAPPPGLPFHPSIRHGAAEPGDRLDCCPSKQETARRTCEEDDGEGLRPTPGPPLP
jgi:hypothetical protein